MTAAHPAELTEAERVRLREDALAWDPDPEGLEAAERERNEAALDSGRHEGELDRLREGAEALAVLGVAEHWPPDEFRAALRALLSTSSVRGEGDG